ncbi:MAG: RES family NAD+ phosphorylase [Devosiaceae bacterium]|nr:RES family NAD+ phosphorylase [Devosiaceae bacterium]
MIELEEIPFMDFGEQTTIRLISTAYIEEPALTPLVEDLDELKILEQLEMLTSARHNSLTAIPPDVTPDELLSPAHGFGWTYINAAFCYTRTSGNRFNTPTRGAWYAAYGKQAAPTSQAEVAFHLSNELDNVGIYNNTPNFRELRAGFATILHDLSGFTNHDFLHPDPAIAYGPGQLLAQNIRQSGGNGVLYPSARNPGGKCLAAFRPNMVQNIRLGQTWQFKWEGGRKPTISRAKNFNQL